MFLLDELLERAKVLQATDIHLLLTSKDCEVVFRKARLEHYRCYLQRPKGYQIIDFIMFHCSLKKDRTLKENFFHLSFERAHVSIRASLSMNKNPYLTLRLHHLNDTDCVDHKDEEIEQILNSMEPPYYINIVGPINSGKTTLYYRLLKYLHKKRQTILSIEEPIEKYFDFWQVELGSHEHWLTLYEHLIRFDLDCIGFGEIRKNSYHTILKRLYQAGHQVVATFHCHDINDWLNRQYLRDLNSTIPIYFIQCHSHRYSLYYSKDSHAQRL